MISTDIILVVALICLIIVILNLNIVNSKKARQKQTEKKLNEIKETTKVVKEEKPQPVADNGNYLHEYFNDKNSLELEDVNLKEVSADEAIKTTKAIGEIKKFNTTIPEYIDEIETTANIVYEMDEAVDESDDYEEDYAIGVEDDDEEFKNALSEEFSNLSPAMKAFIMANILKTKNDKPNDDKI